MDEDTDSQPQIPRRHGLEAQVAFENAMQAEKVCRLSHTGSLIAIERHNGYHLRSIAASLIALTELATAIEQRLYERDRG